jgi:hypothetical protein
MKGNIWVLSIIIAGLFLIGFVFIFCSNIVRDYYFKSFKQGVDKVGLLTSWIDKYPNLWFFKAFGLLIWLFIILIIVLVVWKRR